MEGGSEPNATRDNPYTSPAWAMIEHDDADISESVYTDLIKLTPLEDWRHTTPPYKPTRTPSHQ